ncbi:MAG: hypothetical protein AAGK32_07055, partial [Actinomycetota bacterium]
ALGVERVMGRPLGGLHHLPIDDPAIAALLADADGRTNRLGAALGPDGVLRVSSAPGVAVDPVTVSDPAEVPAACARPTGREVPGAFELHLDLDLGAPAPAGIEPVGLETTLERIRLSPGLAGEVAQIIAGPGVLREDAVDDLRAFAERTGWGVLNTFGAKGLFAWDHPLHLGTAGLQADDFRLAGVVDALFAVTVGIDPAEVPPGDIGTTQQIVLHPRHLTGAADDWPEPTTGPERPPLYTELAAVVGPGYESDAVPLHPARAARDLAVALGPEVLVAADPGPAGLWVARTFPTEVPGQVLVPATNAEGIAAAIALVAGFDGRPAVAITTDPVDATTSELLSLARALEVPLTVEAWGADAELDGPHERIGALMETTARPGADVLPVPVDLAATRELVDVAGAMTAWQGA